jgi:acetyl-CoA synthetase
VSEAAVVGYPHDIRVQGIYAHVTLVSGGPPSAELHKEIVVWGAQGDRADSKADLIEFLLGLPKTCSGKIMRRILWKIAEDEFGPIGDS